MSKHLTRAEREYRKNRLMYLLCIVLWAVFLVVLLFFDKPIPEVVEEPQEVSEEIAVTVIPEAPQSEAEATTGEFDPVRDDIPLDAELQRLLYQACGETGIRYELALAVIWQETDFRNIVGDGGESSGYMQVQKKWHRDRMERLGVSDLSDPYGNFLVGLDYLSELLERYDLSDALTAYNSGKPGNSQYAENVLNYMNILTTEDF